MTSWFADSVNTVHGKTGLTAVAVPCVEWIVKRLVEVDSRA